MWRLVDFLLEGFVFLLIGQQLPPVVRGLSHYSVATITAAAAISVGLVLVLRPLWLVLTQSLPRSLHTRLGGEGGSGRLTGREVVVLSWSGTRGVISLAAIFTLPLATDAGKPFPGRDLLLFCTFLVVLVTLVGQGLTFGPLVRRLGLRADHADMARLRNQARSESVRAALARLDEVGETVREGETAALAEGLDGVDADSVTAMRDLLETRLARYRSRLDLLEDADDSDELPVSPEYEAALRLRRLVIDAQREELLRLRDAGRLPDEGLRVLERELDHEERLLPDRPR